MYKKKIRNRVYHLNILIRIFVVLGHQNSTFSWTLFSITLQRYKEIQPSSLLLSQHFRDSVENCCFWVRTLRLGSRTIAGSADFQQAAGHSKNSALVTDVDTTSGLVIPLGNLQRLETK